MPAAKQLDGQVFGRLTVIERFRSRNGRVTWLCRCECGRLHEAVSHALTSGHTKSCGCWKEERNTSTPPTHGHASRRSGLSPTYQSWRGMWTRRTNSNVKSYKDYGGRGVQICKRWEDFENFLADMGERPEGRTLDRVDVNGNYEPSNCRWATRKEQATNSRRVRRYEYRGKSYLVGELAEMAGVANRTMGQRLLRVDVETAVNTPRRYKDQKTFKEKS